MLDILIFLMLDYYTIVNYKRVLMESFFVIVVWCSLFGLLVVIVFMLFLVFFYVYLMVYMLLVVLCKFLLIVLFLLFFIG
ncbi:ABC transporter permease, partial [Enterococcus hirae]